MCNCIHFGPIERCKEFGIPLFQRESCTEHVLRVLNIGVSGIPGDRLEEKAGMCTACSGKLHREMWALRWEWTSRQSEDWMATQKDKQHKDTQRR